MKRIQGIMDTSNDIVDVNDYNLSRREASKPQSTSTLTMMTKTAAQIPKDDADESSTSTTAGLSSPLHVLSKCPSWWHSLPLHWTRQHQRPCPRRKSQRRLPVLPHTILLEILSYCDAPTSLAFREYSRVFRDYAIPRLFHDRAMTKLNPLSSENENNQVRKRSRRRKLPTSRRDNKEKSVREAVRYSYKRKVVDEEERKVWIFLRDQTNNGDLPRIQQHPKTSSCSNKNKNFDTNPHHWNLQTVTTKVLKLIHDCEFYDGAVYGYDENKAKELLLQKGCIDDGDFPQPILPSSSKEYCWRNRNILLRRSSSQNLLPAYGRWRAEASVRPVSLQEALEIISGNKGSMNVDGCKRQRRRWRSPFPKRSKIKRNKPSTQIRQSGSVDEMVLALLLAASGRSSLSEYDAASETATATTAGGGGGDEDGIGIRLAEYSTVFENTKMSCSVLLVRTINGAEAEVRILSGRVEHKPLESTSASALAATSSRWWHSRSSEEKLSSVSRHSDSTRLTISRHSNVSLTN
jgi:hypothetical protein